MRQYRSSRQGGDFFLQIFTRHNSNVTPVTSDHNYCVNATWDHEKNCKNIWYNLNTCSLMHVRAYPCLQFFGWPIKLWNSFTTLLAITWLLDYSTLPESEKPLPFRACFQRRKYLQHFEYLQGCKCWQRGKYLQRRKIVHLQKVDENGSYTKSRWEIFIYKKEMKIVYILVDEKISSTKSRWKFFIYW